ncbi:MAG: hypothetical protein DSY59_03180 [Persephonella sp.]|nr:MAG: hypothetical protein DSY59_03180 [Persephonella sp.]
MFTPKDFKNLSTELKEKQNVFKCGEGALSRTSISRLYYYIFLECREIINDKLNDRNKIIFASEDCKKKHHYIVQVILYRLAKATKNENISFLSNILNEFREIRNDADYNLEIDITFEDYNVLIDFKEEIENCVEELKNIPKNKFNRIFDRLSDKCK